MDILAEEQNEAGLSAVFQGETQTSVAVAVTVETRVVDPGKDAALLPVKVEDSESSQLPPHAKLQDAEPSGTTGEGGGLPTSASGDRLATDTDSLRHDGAQPDVADGEPTAITIAGEGAIDEKENAAVRKAKRLAVPVVKQTGWKSKNSAGMSMRRKDVRQRFGVDRDSGNLLTYHRSKLRYLLKTLVQQEKWHLACGVLSVLIGIPYLNLTVAKNLDNCWSDFATALQVMRRLDKSGSTNVKIRRMFRLLSMQMPNARSRGLVQLELAHFLTGVNDKEAAYDELRPVVDGRHYREDPVANLCLGLTSYGLWYEHATEEVSKMQARENEATMAACRLDDAEETGENDPSEGYDGDVKPLSEQNGFGYTEVQGSRSFSQGGRDNTLFQRSSVGADMDLDGNAWNVFSQASQKSIYEENDEQEFGQMGGEFWRNVFVPASQDLHPRLYPIQVPRTLLQRQYTVPVVDGRTRDLRTTAIKYLKQSLSTAPGMLPALLPLVQLLLADHDIKSALDEVDRSIQSLSGHFIPLSIKVALLESFNRIEPAQLVAGYRDVLRCNPESVSSLTGLAKLYDSGDVGMEALLESICLHLDVGTGDIFSWEKLSSLLLAVKDQEQKFPGLDDFEILKEEATLLPSRGKLQKLFSGRLRWWRSVHFRTGSKWQNDNPLLIAHKAACAAHIYGPRSDFVVEARSALEGHHRELQLMEDHCERCLELF